MTHRPAPLVIRWWLLIDTILATALALFAVSTTLIAAAGAITVVVLGVMLW
ncbi:MAG: hypothetical protein ACK57N_13480 [Planctomycetia bacterium]